MKEICLSGEQGRGLKAIVDDDIYEVASGVRWHIEHPVNGNGYVVSTYQNGKKVRLHHLVVGQPTGKMDVDHIDGNKLNNQRTNLRIVTRRQNARKSEKNALATTSKFKGVWYEKETRRWRAGITVDYRGIKLGRFPTEVDAALAYNEAAKRYFGEFAILNSVELTTP